MLQLFNATHFHRAARRERRDARGDRRRLVQIVAIDKVEAAELFFGLGESSIGTDRLAVLYAHGFR
jgi:hypothetical protein